MTDKPTLDQPQPQPPPPPPYDSEDSGDAGRALLVGVLGGLVSAAGYLIYRRLPDEQRDRLHKQVRSAVEGRINEIRSNLNI
jgi:hypothetical protein